MSIYLELGEDHLILAAKNAVDCGGATHLELTEMVEALYQRLLVARAEHAHALQQLAHLPRHDTPKDF